MDKLYTNSNILERPAADDATGFAQDASRRNTAAPEIVQVAPPEKRKKPIATGRDEAEPAFFPMVSAAHEFKTPLVVMLGYTDLLRNGHLGGLNAKQKEVLGEIQDSAQRLQRLIQDLILLWELKSTNSAPAVKQDREEADVNESLKEIFAYWVPVARQKSIRYELELAPGSPRVQVDPFKLQHTISNLIENALKFTPQSGAVVVSAMPCFWERRKAQSHFLFNLERKKNIRIENAVRIDVRDTGPGISPEHHEDIFEDFVQLQGSSRGTGLGLAIARRLVEAHHGAVWVESKPGEGSKFSVLLSQIK